MLLLILIAVQRQPQLLSRRQLIQMQQLLLQYLILVQQFLQGMGLLPQLIREIIIQLTLLPVLLLRIPVILQLPQLLVLIIQLMVIPTLQQNLSNRRLISLRKEPGVPASGITPRKVQIIFCIYMPAL